jgi:hypothetical protein
VPDEIDRLLDDEPPRRPGVEAEDEFLTKAGLADPVAEEEEIPPEPEHPGVVTPEQAVEAALHPFEGTLPAEVERIWCVSPQSEATARTLIQAWGLEAFLTSSLHRQAVLDASREKEMEPLRAAYLKAMKAKEKR